jgi:hypothetical protein
VWQRWLRSNPLGEARICRRNGVHNTLGARHRRPCTGFYATYCRTGFIWFLFQSGVAPFPRPSAQRLRQSVCTS